MTITVRDWTTGAPMGPPFMTLLTFHHGVTVSESNGNLERGPS